MGARRELPDPLDVWLGADTFRSQRARREDGQTIVQLLDHGRIAGEGRASGFEEAAANALNDAFAMRLLNAEEPG